MSLKTEIKTNKKNRVTSDPLADCLTRIRNAITVNKTAVLVPYSRLKAELIQLLQAEGFIKSYEIINNDNPAMKSIVIELKYYQGQSVIKGIKRVSKPGLRKYVKSKYVPRVLNGLGICVLSTNIGLVTDRKARAEKVGGEMLCLVW